MRIAEIFKSVQGEGLLTGTESVFVRVSGCNLRCRFCDTPYASWRPAGRDLAVDDILRRVSEWSCRHVVVTGGEPMLYAELLPLCDALRRMGRHVTIETAGTLYLPVACDLMSISPKLSNSTPSPAEAGSWSARHEQTRWAPAVVRRLIRERPYQLKFVVERPEDAAEVEQWLEHLPEAASSRVLLMPQGVEREALARAAEWLAPLCRRRGWRYCPRRHIEWFGLQPGT